MRLRHAVVAVMAAVLLSACANRSIRDVSIEDSGQAYKVKFGTVLSQKPVNIRTEAYNATKGGVATGATAGALIGSASGPEGTMSGFVLSSVLGGVVGIVGHSVVETNNGVEYVIALADGTTQIIDQVQSSSDPVYPAGHPVIVQYGANINRVLSAADLPLRVRAPKVVRVDGAPAPQKNIGVKHCQETENEGTDNTVASYIFGSSRSTNSSRKSCTYQ
jgi:outer membrane lipoprotein SlyB